VRAQSDEKRVIHGGDPLRTSFCVVDVARHLLKERFELWSDLRDARRLKIRPLAKAPIDERFPY
jgi:hypothetical protein